MKFSAFLCVIFLCTACVSKEQQEQQANELAQKQFDAIDLSTPDSYPQFAGCDELVDAQKCFYQKLYEQINDKLQLEPLDIQMNTADTVTAIIKVSNKGLVSYVALKDQNSTVYTAAIDSVLASRLSNLCQVNPAIKQGVPIESSYLLPIIMKPTE